MTDCPCACHTGPGAYPPPCDQPGGCGPHDQAAEETPRCLRGPDCEAAERIEQVAVGAPSPRPLCRECEQATTAALRAAPDLYVRLRNATIDRLGGASAHDGRVRRSRSGSFGLNAGPLALAEGLHWHVTSWADEVIATAGRPTADRASQPEGGQVQDACVLLGRYLSVWVAHGPVEFAVTRENADPDDPKGQPTGETVTVTQAGWEACSWLVGWRRSAERLLRLPRLVHYPPEPCPQCDQPGTLRREDGDDHVRCMSCRKSWTLDKYETFVHAWLGGAAAPMAKRRRGPGSDAAGQDARVGSASHALAAQVGAA